MIGSRIRMLRLGNLLIQEVTRFKSNARVFCYEAYLLGHACPMCNNKLRMIQDSKAVCPSCKTEVDPTVYFQSCQDCGGALRRRVSHYSCERCGKPTRSQFAFDTATLDRGYFAQMMRKSRERQHRRRALMREHLLYSRSKPVMPDAVPDLSRVTGLAGALDGMAQAPLPPNLLNLVMNSPEFDMERYRRHIINNVNGYEVLFDMIPPILSDQMRDRIFRFVAAIHMWHHGEIGLTQQNNILVVTRNEPDSEGQRIS